MHIKCNGSKEKQGAVMFTVTGALFDRMVPSLFKHPCVCVIEYIISTVATLQAYI